MAEELNNESMNSEATEALAEMANSESGTDMVIGGGVGAVAGGFVGSKIGYGKAIRDLAKATGKDPKTLLDEIKKAKEQEKPKKGKWRLRNPFYREPVSNEPVGDKPEEGDNAKEEEKETKPEPKKAKQPK